MTSTQPTSRCLIRIFCGRCLCWKGRSGARISKRGWTGRERGGCWSMKSSLPFTSVVSLHTNTFGCGVAKFSQQLAERLGVPFIGVSDDWGDYPLLSLKWSECLGDFELLMDKTANRYDAGRSTAAFWHDAGGAMMASWCQPNYFADPSLGPNGLWCPSLIQPSKPRTVKLFSFGMAHKLQTQHYAKVRHLLDAAGLDYHLRVSVGLHEGTSLSDAMKHFDALYEILGRDRVTILGILSDDAVSEELANTDYVLAFFEQGVRANNTTVHAALDVSCRVITNIDSLSPSPLKNEVLDIATWWI